MDSKDKENGKVTMTTSLEPEEAKLVRYAAASRKWSAASVIRECVQMSIRQLIRKKGTQ